jgi:translation initiation factor IF-3
MSAAGVVGQQPSGRTAPLTSRQAHGIVFYTIQRSCREALSRGEGNISGKDLRINERIRVREVRLIGDNGEQLGVLAIQEALRIARERSLDLVEVAPTAVPPVCRLLDYGRFKYEQQRKEREARKNQKVVLLKEVRLTPKTDDHDIDFKSRMIQRFIEDGDKVKVTVRFKGREMAHPQLGRQALDTIANNLKPYASLERTPLIEGRTMTMILTPLHSVKDNPPKDTQPKDSQPKEAPAREPKEAPKPPVAAPTGQSQP